MNNIKYMISLIKIYGIYSIIIRSIYDMSRCNFVIYFCGLCKRIGCKPTAKKNILLFFL